MLRPIAEIAEELGLAPSDVEPRGRHVAKVSRAADPARARGSLVLVTAVTPTPQGEGKTTVVIGLVDALRRLGIRAVATLRQPSLGPVFGRKGGGSGGGRSQVVPAEQMNLHLTGDFHAVTAAHNLAAALVDNHLNHGNALGIDVKLSWSVFQIVGAVDLLAGARNVPGRRAMQKLLRAASQHGVIVKPGEVYSFNQHLGDVSLDNGYAEALIIFNGQTVKGVGGGVCQVSTTAFRAAFNGGYPIIERWPHAYRVGWYERGFGPGLDATVFSPYVDFKFKNDTPYHILIEAYANDAAGRLTFKFYSTSDGRQVTISDPIVENVIPHPEDKIEEDPTLPAGTRQQVDYAADGADVTVKRTVTRDGQVISEDQVFTRYQPWQAIFKVGTGGAAQ